MKENDVASLAEQFGLTKEIVEASISDGTLGQRIKDSMKDKHIYTEETLSALKQNLSAEATTSYFNDLVSKAKQGDVPHDLYAPIKGAAYQQLEKDLSKKYEIGEYENVTDLVEKIVKSSANGNVNEELERQLNALKQTNLDLVKEKEEAVTKIEAEYRTKELNRAKSELLNAVPFDFSGVKSDEVAQAKERTQTLLKSVFDSNHELTYNDAGKLVVLKDGEVLKSTATHDPLEAKDVLINLAKEFNLKLTSPDNGGQGGKSSGTNTGQYESVEAFEKDMESKGIKTTDPKYYEHYKNSGLSNRK